MTTPELLTRLIAATEDMIERLESCIADGNGELEDDRPAILEAQEAVAAAKASLYPAEGETPQPVNLHGEEREFETEREGAYFVIMLGIIGDHWLARDDDDEVDLFDAQREAIERALLDGIDSGALYDAGVSEETIAAICAEWGIENAVDTWNSDMEDWTASVRQPSDNKEGETP